LQDPALVTLSVVFVEYLSSPPIFFLFLFPIVLNLTKLLSFNNEIFNITILKFTERKKGHTLETEKRVPPLESLSKS